MKKRETRSGRDQVRSQERARPQGWSKQDQREIRDIEGKTKSQRRKQNHVKITQNYQREQGHVMRNIKEESRNMQDC